MGQHAADPLVGALASSLAASHAAALQRLQPGSWDRLVPALRGLFGSGVGGGVPLQGSWRWLSCRRACTSHPRQGLTQVGACEALCEPVIVVSQSRGSWGSAHMRACRRASCLAVQREGCRKGRVRNMVGQMEASQGGAWYSERHMPHASSDASSATGQGGLW